MGPVGAASAKIEGLDVPFLNRIPSDLACWAVYDAGNSVEEPPDNEDLSSLVDVVPSTCSDREYSGPSATGYCAVGEFANRIQRLGILQNGLGSPVRNPRGQSRALGRTRHAAFKTYVREHFVAFVRALELARVPDKLHSKAVVELVEAPGVVEVEGGLGSRQ